MDVLILGLSPVIVIVATPAVSLPPFVTLYQLRQIARFLGQFDKLVLEKLPCSWSLRRETLFSTLQLAYTKHSYISRISSQAKRDELFERF